MTAHATDGPQDGAADGDASPIPPLAGFTVGVAAARHHEGLIAMLEQRGARVVHAPAIRPSPPGDDAELLQATWALLSGAADVLVVTAASGFRGWLDTADGWGLRERLLERLRGMHLVAHGPKARGALRSAGLSETWSPATEPTGELVRRMIEDGPAGRRVFVQRSAEPLPPGFAAALRAAGAEVTEVTVYGETRRADSTALRRLVGQTVAGTVDALAFTSRPAVTTTLAVAGAHDMEEALVGALRTKAVAACAGPATAAPLERRGVPTVQPDGARLGALVRALVDAVPERRARRLVARGHTLELRGHAVVLDGTFLHVAPAPMAVLRGLARRPGHVFSRAELYRVLPGRTAPGAGSGAGPVRAAADEHAVEMAIARLRRRLGRPDLIETVVKRGYRLACDPADRRSGGADRS